MVRLMEISHPNGHHTPPLNSVELDITFFVPCYNEQNNVVGAIEKLVELARRRQLSYEILIFDDCSKDRTVKIVKDYQRAHPDLPVRLFANEINRGVSRNFVEAAFQGRGKYIRLVCGDDIEPLETHLRILKCMGEADIIVPYFTKIEGRKLHRHIVSRLYTAAVNVASGYSLKYYNGCPIYRRYDVMRFHVEATGFGYQAEFLTRLLHEGKSYIEVSVVAIDREGSGSINLRNFISVGHSLLKIALRQVRVYLFK